MHKQMYALIPNGKKPYIVEIFGYATKGIPGLEIVGLGAKGKSIKEKFIYLNKKLNQKLPPRRFVLCVEDQFLNSNKEDLFRWLELPFLIMYWSMAGVLPIQFLDDCLCGGRISARGEIETSPVEEINFDELENFMSHNMKLITKEGHQSGHNYSFIPLEEIVSFKKLLEAS